MSRWWCYVIETEDQQLYTGISTDPERRFAEHYERSLGTGKVGAKYFCLHKPKKIVFLEECSDRSAASKREYAIKKMSRVQKERLIELAQTELLKESS